MTQENGFDRLGPLDAGFLYLEKKEMPLHIGAVLIFDGPMDEDRLTALIEAKLPLIPRYRQRVFFPPLHAGRPSWEYDPDFDIRRHIHSLGLSNGTQVDLQELAGKLFAEVMDRNRPLWDLTLVNGLEHGHSALIARVHHCLVDGIAGVAMLNVLLDDSPHPHRVPPPPAFHAPPPRDPATRFLDAILGSYSDMLRRAITLEESAVNFAGSLLTGASLDEPARMVNQLVTPLDKFPFNGLVRGPRHFSFTNVPLEDAMEVRQACGVKLNDVILAIVTDAVRRYTELHHQPIEGHVIRYMVPVNLREDVNSLNFGNRISFLQASLPADIKDPLELLKATHRETELLKHAHGADLTVLLGSLVGMLPDAVQALGGDLLANVAPVIPWNMVCTNVPGPKTPLYALGREMLTYYGYVPIGQDMGLGIAITSYNGKLFFGLTGDSAMLPDLDRLRDFLLESLAALRQAAGLERPKAGHRAHATKRPRRKRAHAAVEQPAKTLAATPAAAPPEAEVVKEEEPVLA